jgi:hypothetical protein
VGTTPRARRKRKKAGEGEERHTVTGTDRGDRGGKETEAGKESDQDPTREARGPRKREQAEKRAPGTAEGLAALGTREGGVPVTAPPGFEPNSGHGYPRDGMAERYARACGHWRRPAYATAR